MIPPGLRYGAAPAVFPPLGGNAPVAFLALRAVAANVRDGSLRALAVSSAKRSVEFPHVPTLTEAGFPTTSALP